jgi:hypothetical protein
LSIKYYERTFRQLQTSSPSASYYGDDLIELPSDVEIDGIEDEVQEIPVSPAVDDDDVVVLLQCPKCELDFEQDDHFLEHVNMCIE